MTPDVSLKPMSSRWLRRLSVCVALVAPLSMAQAQSELDWRLSGFGTIGYAQSNRDYNYQRFINSQGTFKRDSLLGAQMDVGIAPGWSATWQVTAAPSLRNDDDWSLTTAWAFVSWRPDNDWQFRLGKQRVPLFLYTANRDVGQTYDLLRLPAEVYGITPSTDFTGVSMTKNWLFDAGELSLDLYGGSADLDVRSYSRDLGATFLGVRTTAVGASLAFKLEDRATFLGSVYRTKTRRRDGGNLPAAYNLTSLPYGMGSFYAVDPSLPDVGTDHISNDVVTLGANVVLTPTWRMIGEVARNFQHRTSVGANTVGGYLALLHEVGHWTPYLSVARLRSLGGSLDTADAIGQTQVSSALGATAAQINLSQRIASDSIRAYDQTTVSFGASYSLTPRSKLKAEWARTDVGRRSAMVDSPANGDVVRHQSIDVWSISYSFAF